ncbi:MAG: glycosyltransferase family 2 protein [Gammaproteobacteria bacterium]|nr:glycosyltransferase family 2 protein [Gammaproteobacteria bacterium]
MSVNPAQLESRRSDREIDPSKHRPFVSLVLPAFNEEPIIDATLQSLLDYMAKLESKYRWELIIIDDGSTDRTAALAEAFASQHDNVYFLSHFTNFGLGQALKFAFNNCSGDYILTLDADLSYAPSHIERLLETIQESRAKIVVASPYLKGGKISNVPWLRKTLSITANRFLALAAKNDLSTITSMVRVYDARFLKSLPLKSMGMDIIPEIIYKSMILGARIEEIPAHLDWSSFKSATTQRRSSMRVVTHTFAILFSGFLFRPFMFFVIPGLILLLFSVYVNVWMIAHFVGEFSALTGVEGFFPRASAAVGAAYANQPHTFIIGLLSLMLSIQLIGLGILSLQNKSYFEEIFHLGVLSGRNREPK